MRNSLYFITYLLLHHREFINFLKRIFSFVLGLAASIRVEFLPNARLFEGRTVTLECANSTINQTSAVWYKDDEVINNSTRNLTLTLKSSDTGLYKCGINKMNSTTGLNVTVKGMIHGVL